MSLLHSMLSHPLTRGLDLDDPQTTELRKEIVEKKPFLKKIYKKWYSQILANLPSIDGSVLELGTGAGFLKEYVPDLITSDIIQIKGNDVTCNALELPFTNDSLRAIVMLNVLHHIPEPDVFFQEGSRCLKKGGTLIMIEPWVSAWSRFIYSNLNP